MLRGPAKWCRIGFVVLMAFVAAVPAQAAMTKDIVYATVDGKPLKLDLYMPTTKASPLVVYVHGGVWRNGDKSAGAAFAERLVGAGFAVASVDFRQTTAAPFPANIHDIKAAVRFLRAKAGDYGYDAERIAIAGESSGAHLALLTGVTNGNTELEGKVGDYLATSSSVQAIVSYFAATDLTTILAQSTPFGLGVREPGLKLLLGDLPDQKPELARLASPVFQVDANDPPLYLLHGDRDPQMPVNQSLQMWGVYKDKGLDVTFDPVHGAGHGGPLFFTPEHQQAVVAFLRRTLRPHP
ncbi:MAG TPA: alpha/beta hydrolase, partial [Candidatus Acidoferrum sp.]|nr:alpha/beta hydrolase [Candidatus Acidoferrum sp.]